MACVSRFMGLYTQSTKAEAISMNAFDKVHEYGEGGAGHNGALEPAASQRPLRCYGFQV